MGKKLTTQEFINRAIKIHGDKYDYSKTSYANTNTKIIIKCNIHGIVFTQTPHNHLKYNGCPQCLSEFKHAKYKKTNNEFITMANTIHNNKYDYSNSTYINMDTPITIKCKVHGNFKQTPRIHIHSKSGCPKCYGSIKYTIDEIIAKANHIHNNVYDYSKSIYVNMHTKIEIICPNHGIFFQAPHTHINAKHGCPLCNSSKGERSIEIYLSTNNIQYIREHTFNKCKGKKRKLPFDFYLPNHNMCIEYDGSQHYLPNNHFGGIDTFKQTQNNDNIKTKYCDVNNITLLRIPYWEFSNIHSILSKFTSKFN